MNKSNYEYTLRLWSSYQKRKEDTSLSVDDAYLLELADINRQERNRLLQASDYRMVSDAPWDTAEWATYRQQLRDLPSTEGFPHSITWPTEPSN
jgi:hypothetical protein